MMGRTDGRRWGKGEGQGREASSGPEKGPPCAPPPLLTSAVPVREDSDGARECAGERGARAPWFEPRQILLRNGRERETRIRRAIRSLASAGEGGWGEGEPSRSAAHLVLELLDLLILVSELLLRALVVLEPRQLLPGRGRNCGDPPSDRRGGRVTPPPDVGCAGTAWAWGSALGLRLALHSGGRRVDQTSRKSDNVLPVPLSRV